MDYVRYGVFSIVCLILKIFSIHQNIINAFKKCVSPVLKMVYYFISCGKKTLIKIFIIFFVTVITGFRFNVRKRLVPGNNYPGTFLTAKTCSAFLDSVIPFIISWVLTANMTQLVFTEIYNYLAQIFLFRNGQRSFSPSIKHPGLPFWILFLSLFPNSPSHDR